MEWALPIADDDGGYGESGLGKGKGVGYCARGGSVYGLFLLWSGRKELGWEEIIALWMGTKEALCVGGSFHRGGRLYVGDGGCDCSLCLDCKEGACIMWEQRDKG